MTNLLAGAIGLGGQPYPSENHSPTGLVTLTLATTTYTLYQISPGNTARIIKIHAFSALAGLLNIGISAFTQVFPSIYLPAGIDVRIPVDEIVAYWFRELGSATTDIVAQCSVAGATCFVEVEEKGLG